MKNTVILTTASSSNLTPRLMDALGKADRNRFEKLLPLFKAGKANLAEALLVIAPERERAEALRAYQTLCVNVKEAAAEAGVSLRLAVDSRKRNPPEDRETWLEGADPAADNLAKYTGEATGALARTDALVPPQAVIVTGNELATQKSEKPLIRFFVSYAHADDTIAEQLQRKLEAELSISKTYCFEVWSDRKILAGEPWAKEIETAIGECDFGLLFVSRDFLISPFITSKELPHFVGGSKPVIPISLTTLDFTRCDLKGLEERQLFMLARTGEAKRPFDRCRQPGLSEEFVRALATTIEERIKKTPVTPPPTVSAPAGQKRSIEAAGSQSVSHLGHNILEKCNLEGIVDPEGAATALTNYDADGITADAKRTSAVDYLTSWAVNPDAPPFCAVLGEVGIGKTTTLMLVARRMEEMRERNPSIPPAIFIDLKDYHFDGEPDLEKILEVVIKRHWQGETSIDTATVITAVREQGALIIFDGLDERIIPLPESRRNAFIRELWRILPPASFKPTHGAKRGKMIISCRSHYFPTVTAMSSAFTGEQREGIKTSDYTACIILPFRKEQVRAYLAGVLGEERVDGAMEVIRSVHNLTDLSQRPYLLSLIAPELERIESMRAEGKTVFGMTLYRLFVEKWLAREGSKHQFSPDHKMIMMPALAAHLAKINEKSLPWNKVSAWLDDFLQAHPAIRERYRDKSAEVLNQDFRTATFCLRPDDSQDHFHFAHTSLYEYFLALWLVRALEENHADNWNLPLSSDETYDFFGQMLAELPGKEQSKLAACWAGLLENPTLPADTRRGAFRAWLVCARRGWPQPTPSKARLDGLDLEKWIIEKPSAKLDLRFASFEGACLDYTRWVDVLLMNASFDCASLRLAELQDCDLSGASFEKANLTGGTWRDCAAPSIQAGSAKWHDCDVIRCDIANAVLPAYWDCKAGPNKDSPLELVLRQGHTSCVNSVAWSRDGTRACSGDETGTVRFWDVFSGRCFLEVPAHKGQVRSVGWSPDGEQVCSGGADGMIKLWDADSGVCLLQIPAHQRRVMSVCWSPDGTRVCSGGDDGKLKIWDVNAGRSVLEIPAHKGIVTSVCWSPDGTQLCSGSSNGVVKLWDAASGRRVNQFSAHELGVMSVCWSPESARVCSGGDEGKIRIWEATSGRCLLDIPSPSFEVMSVCWSPDGLQLSSGHAGGMVKIWDVASARCLLAIPAHDQEAMSVAWSPDSTKVISGGQDGTVKLWEVVSGRSILTLSACNNDIRSVCWSPDGSQLCSGSDDGMLRLWDGASGRLLLDIPAHTNGIFDLAWSPNGSWICSAGGEGEFPAIWNAVTGELIWRSGVSTAWPMAVAWSPDGTRICVVGIEDTIVILNGTTGKASAIFSANLFPNRSLAWSPDGTRLLTGGFSGLVAVWDATTGNPFFKTPAHKQTVTSVAWAPNGLGLCSAGVDGTIRFLAPESGSTLFEIAAHNNGVWAVAWSPDGKQVCSGGGDGAIMLWDASSGRALLELPTHQHVVSSVRWSPDGARICSGGADGTVRIWDARTGAPIWACVTTGREHVTFDATANRIIHASKDGWRLVGWQGWDEKAGRRRMFPAEIFGPLPE